MYIYNESFGEVLIELRNFVSSIAANCVVQEADEVLAVAVSDLYYLTTLELEYLPGVGEAQLVVVDEHLVVEAPALVHREIWDRAHVLKNHLFFIEPHYLVEVLDVINPIATNWLVRFRWDCDVSLLDLHVLKLN